MSRRFSRPRKIRPTFTVFCEGKTEKAYVSFLKRKFRMASVIMNPKVAGNDISDTYIRKYKEANGGNLHEKDKEYLMYDLDVTGVLENLKSIKDVIVIASNPCIELWFLFHYAEQTVSIQTGECVRKLRKQVSDYQKGKITSTWAKYLDQHTGDAVDRASKLAEYGNPSSLVYKLIHDLEVETNL